jgi:DNA-binding transcriptional LysR family regulator
MIPGTSQTDSLPSGDSFPLRVRIQKFEDLKYVSQPAVSVAIKELEALFGQPLFQRQPAKGLTATAFALEKLPEARALSSDHHHTGGSGSGRA